jgi:hypothetical protein
VIRLLATVPGIEHVGRTLDPSGEAFAVFADQPGPATRHTIVLDPATGRLLAHEEVATTGTATVHTPAVTQLERFLADDRVDAVP